MSRHGIRKPRDRLKSEQFEAQVRMRLADGLSVAAIAKQLGRSYKHTANIAARIKAGGA